MRAGWAGPCSGPERRASERDEEAAIQWSLGPGLERGSRLAEEPGVLLGRTAGQPVTVKVADATLPLWRPLAWKVSFLPG